MCWLRLIDAYEVPFTSRMSHASGVVAGSYRGTGDTTWVDTAPAAARRRPGLARSWKRGRPAGAGAGAPAGVGTTAGMPNEQSSSMPRLEWCILILKKPWMPQYVPQLLRPIQYSSPLSASLPQPTSASSWFGMGTTQLWLKMPPVYWF